MSKHEGIRIFSGGVAIMTGGASGIGLALSKALAKRGCEVILADLQEELAAEEAEKMVQSGGKASAVKLDVTDAAAVATLVEETVARCGRLDYMFNNAGIGAGVEVKDYDLEDWDYVIDVNIRGVVHGVQAAYTQMCKQGYGHIINTASMAGLIPTSVIVNYSMSKHAVVGLSTSLRSQAAHYGVRVSALCPGVIRTPILHGGAFGRLPEDLDRSRFADLFERTRPMDPDIFADKVLRRVARNQAIIVVPSFWKLAWWLYRLSPRLGIYLSTRAWKEAKQELDKM